MRKLLPLLLTGAALTGCLSSKSAKMEVGKKPMPGLEAEAKLAERLPIVTPESVNPHNASEKATQLAEELRRGFSQGEITRTVAEVRK